MSNMHPPVDRRCQIYLGIEAESPRRALDRCLNEGDHWEKWGGCNCATPDSEVCEGDYYSWECGGDHVTKVVAR